MLLDAKRYLGEILREQPKQTGGWKAHQEYRSTETTGTPEVLPPPSLRESAAAGRVGRGAHLHALSCA